MKANFQKWLVALLTALCGAILPAVSNAAVHQNAPRNIVYLELDGTSAGPLIEFAGGAIVAPVITTKTGSGKAAEKRLGPVEYEKIVLTFGTAMETQLYQWMQEALADKRTARNGALVFLDSNFNVLKRLEFANAVISEIGFSALNASDAKADFRFTLAIVPQTVWMPKGGGGQFKTSSSRTPKAITSHFRITMPGVNTQYVSSIEPISIRMPIVQVASGSAKDEFGRTTSSPAEVGDVIINVMENGSQEIWNWADEFMIHGKNGNREEKVATVEILDQSMKNPILTITLQGLGIYRLEPAANSTSTSNLSTVRVSMYCKSLQFQISNK